MAAMSPAMARSKGSPTEPDVYARTEHFDSEALASTSVGNGHHEEAVAVCSGAWDLVWCSERCFKPKYTETSAGMTEMMAHLGGVLVPLKKAQRLQAWTSSMPEKAEYALLMDWRETKPCLHILAQMEDSTPSPFMLIVLYEQAGNAKPVWKVKKWAGSPRELRGSTRKFRIEVVETLEEAEALLREVRAGSGSLTPPRCGDTGLKPQCDSVNRFVELDAIVTPDVLGKPSSCTMAPPSASATTDAPKMEWSPFRSAPSTAMSNPVALMMSRVCPSGNANDLSAMLMAAKPTEYCD